jgi:hypothetical protein
VKYKSLGGKKMKLENLTEHYTELMKLSKAKITITERLWKEHIEALFNSFGGFEPRLLDMHILGVFGEEGGGRLLFVGDKSDYFYIDHRKRPGQKLELKHLVSRNGNAIEHAAHLLSELIRFEDLELKTEETLRGWLENPGDQLFLDGHTFWHMPEDKLFATIAPNHKDVFFKICSVQESFTELSKFLQYWSRRKNLRVV